MKLKIISEACVILLFASLAGASILPDNCSAFGGEQRTDCENILRDSSLTLVEKEDLYLNLIESQGALPSHEFAWEWNKKINFTTAPAGVQQKSEGILKSAWVKIVTVHKSVLDLDEMRWLVQPQGDVLSAYNYSVVLPSGTAPGDCRTEYSYKMLAENLGVSLNGKSIGSGKIAQFSAPVADGGQMDFAANLYLKARLEIRHYQTVTTCLIPIFEWTCTSSCVFSHTSYEENELQTSDKFEAQASAPTYGAETTFEKFSGFNKFRLWVNSAGKINELRLQIGADEFSFSELNFDLDTTLEPYGVLYVSRRQEFGKEAKGFIELASDFNSNPRSVTLATVQAEGCSLKLFTDFDEIDMSDKCSLADLKETSLSLTTDKNAYDENETIAATAQLADETGAPLANKKISLAYGSKSLALETGPDGSANADVPASETKGFLSAEFGADAEHKTSEATRRVTVSNPDAWNTAAGAGVFCTLQYCIFLIAKKRFGVFV